MSGVDTRPLGRLRVTTLGLGCANLGNSVDQAGADEIVAAAVDHGITFFDTADRYGEPVTAGETILGESLRGRRDQVVLASKFGRVLDDTRHGASAAYVRSATEASLRRLQTDRIDLMQVHIPDPDTPIAETLGALADLVAEGKILEIGGSNYTGRELDEMNAAARDSGLPGFASTQVAYSLLDRRAEDDELPAAVRLGISVVPYWPLFNGLLTGRYSRSNLPEQSSTIGGKSEARRAEILSESNLDTVERLTDYARGRGRSLLELAYGWLLAHSEIPSVIAGVSRASQIASNAASVGWELTPEERREVETIATRDRAADAATR